MKILLVRYHDGPNINTRLPKSLNRIRGVMPPLGLLSIAAYLEKFGYEPKVLDAVAANMHGSEFGDFVRAYRPDDSTLIGIINDSEGICRRLEATASAPKSTATPTPGSSPTPSPSSGI